MQQLFVDEDQGDYHLFLLLGGRFQLAVFLKVLQYMNDEPRVAEKDILHIVDACLAQLLRRFCEYIVCESVAECGQLISVFLLYA